MRDAPDTLVVSLEGRTLRAVACGRDESLELCAAILRGGDLIATREVDPNLIGGIADDLEGVTFVDATRGAIVAWVERALADGRDDIRDAGREVDDGDGDVPVAA